MGSSSPATTTTINKTELPAWVEQASLDNFDYAKALSGQLPGAYTGNTVAGLGSMDPAFAYAQSLIGSQSGNLANAQAAAQNAYNYTPNTVGFDAVNPNIAAQRVQTQFGGQNVNAQDFTSGNLQGYMNPYLAEVESNALNAIDRQRLGALNQVGDQAISRNAFGGSRLGVMEGVTNAEAARLAGEASANIRSQGFNTAANLMQQDMNRDLTAQQSNQQMGMDLNRLGLQGQLANQSSALTADTANANNQMRLYDQMLQSQIANQQAGLTANQQQIQGALAAGQLANTAQQQGYTDLASLYNIGEQQRAYDQSLLTQQAAQYDAQKAAMLEPLNLRLSALGMSPYGQTSTQTSTGGNTGNSTLSTLGTVGSIGASAATIIAAF